MEAGTLHLAERVGAIMDFTESMESEPEGNGPDISINISSPNNRIAARDYIEVNIHLGPRSGSDAPESNVESATEIQRALTDVADYVRRERHGETASKH